MNELAVRRGLAGAAKLAILGTSLGVTTALRWGRLFPNNDPIMAVTLPCARRGRIAAIAFPVVAMVLFDVLSGRVGVWTAVTAATYGLIGLALAQLYRALGRRGRPVGVAGYVLSGAAGVLAFDFLTGPIMSSVLFDISFAEALVGQVPFTLKHLTSVAAYAAVVSPALDWAFRRIDLAEAGIARRLAAASSRAT